MNASGSTISAWNTLSAKRQDRDEAVQVEDAEALEASGNRSVVITRPSATDANSSRYATMPAARVRYQ